MASGEGRFPPSSLELRSSLFRLARPGGACGCRPVVEGYAGAYRVGRSGRAAGPASGAFPRSFSPGMGAGMGPNGQSFTQIHEYSVCSPRGDRSGSGISRCLLVGLNKTRAAFGPIMPCSSFLLGTTIPLDVGCSLEERQIDSFMPFPEWSITVTANVLCTYPYHRMSL